MVRSLFCAQTHLWFISVRLLTITPIIRTTYRRLSGFILIIHN